MKSLLTEVLIMSSTALGDIEDCWSTFSAASVAISLGLLFLSRKRRAFTPVKVSKKPGRYPRRVKVSINPLSRSAEVTMVGASR